MLGLSFLDVYDKFRHLQTKHAGTINTKPSMDMLSLKKDLSREEIK